MQKQHFLPAFFVMFFGLSLVFMSSYVAAQNAADNNKQVKVKQNINTLSKKIVVQERHCEINSVDFVRRVD